MEVLQEVTKWKDNTPNSAYLVQGQKTVAFRSGTDNSITVFSKPLMLDRGGRRFKKVVDQELIDAFKSK